MIYGFHNQTNLNIKNDIDFLIINNVKHFSFYSLEIKENTLWYKQNYLTDEYKIENHLKFINSYLNAKKFKRYEVSSICKENKYQSLHNVLIWKANDWTAIELGGYGSLYHYCSSITNWQIKKEKLLKTDLYYLIMFMVCVWQKS